MTPLELRMPGAGSKTLCAFINKIMWFGVWREKRQIELWSQLRCAATEGWMSGKEFRWAVRFVCNTKSWLPAADVLSTCPCDLVVFQAQHQWGRWRGCVCEYCGIAAVGRYTAWTLWTVQAPLKKMPNSYSQWCLNKMIFHIWNARTIPWHNIVYIVSNYFYLGCNTVFNIFNLLSWGKWVN